MLGTFSTEKKYYKVSFVKNKSNVKDKNSSTVSVFTLMRPSLPIIQNMG
jgi:hypothetical protein